MASLRRPSQAIQPGRAVQQSSRPPIPAVPSELERKRDVRKSKVDDAIKRRMSMRYAAPPDLSGFVTPPVPGRPNDFLQADPYGGIAGPEAPTDDDLSRDVGESKFGQFGSPEFAQTGFGRSPAVAGEETIRRRGAVDLAHEEEWDMDELSKEGADIHGFIKRHLTGADEEEVKRFKAALQRHKQQNAKELQRNVFKHYAEFVTISKEISTLENDMLELKELLGQWKDLPQLMGMENTLAPTLDKSGNIERRRTQRNSIADLQQMYKAQLTNLWATVEGSQRYLALVPGRHLVFETHNFVELNAATYKAKQSVSMFLLSDLLLIAGRRRTKSGPAGVDDKERERGRMVAERCWVLADLVVIDVKDSGDLTNALKIRRGKEVCVYRTSKAEDKKALLAAFRQVSQELSEKKRKESEKEQERRRTMWQGDPGLMSPGRPLSAIGLSMADSKDLRWLDEFGDELTMAIATRDWDEAVKQVQKGQDLLKTFASSPRAVELLTLRLDQLRPNLVSSIAYDLSRPEIRKTKAVHLISLLTNLGETDLARDTFLKARREVMLKRVRAIKAEGDISIYISELAIVCFTIIRHTSDWYMTAFRENRMASGFVTWAKEQVETFADMFRRQVYAPMVEQGIADESLKVTASANRKLLRDVGLDFTFLLSNLLQPDPNSSSPTDLHPVFNLPAETPAAGYTIDPSPYVPYLSETPAPDADIPTMGSTQPLSIAPRSPRKPRASDIAPEDNGMLSPTSPAPPPRSARRGLAPRTPVEEDSLR
ncbi:exocyst complex component exo84 [Saitozyma podzolica]|uniref:Exocyst complex component EXO84 n=1 Tax=Saitozyma podzolica TaxID=1890683 RepID=A0A427YVV1_9TREE|nr:exocyst complex component exo84 [Saitozyma podzolica]